MGKGGYTDVGDDDVPDAVWDEIFKEAEDKLVKYLKEGKNVANEYAWITKYWRDRIRKIAKDAGFETKLIYLKTDPEIVRQRWAKNRDKKVRDHFHWPEEEFEGFIKNFEEPEDDESVIVYDPNVPLKELIKI